MTESDDCSTEPYLFFTFFHQLSVCSKSKEGNQTLYRKVSGDDGVLICIKNNGQYVWKFLDGKIN
jgi:hypothetical protein